MDIIDRIDELVDGQLQQEASGYDHNINQDKCPHCGRAWHGLPLTRHVAQMYSLGFFEPEYIAAEDDSPIVCDGSDFIGPLRPPTRHINQVAIITVVPNIEGFADGVRRAMAQAAEVFDEAFRSMERSLREFLDGIDWQEWGPFIHTASLPPSQWPQPRSDLPPAYKPGISFGQHNWHFEMQRIPPELQFPRPYLTPLFVSPLAYDVHQLWREFTAPTFPIPESPGYDFSAWADTEPPTAGPEQRHGWNAITGPRRPATAARRNGRRARG